MMHKAMWALVRFTVGVALFAAGAATVPHWWCGRKADAWFDGRADRQAALARAVGDSVEGGVLRSNFSTGNAQFDGEWLFGSYLMAGFGYGQSALEHPEWRARNAALMAQCIAQLLEPRLRAFDRESWGGEDALDSLAGPHGHGAYLGYLNLLLGFHRLLDPASPYAELNDRITEALARRIEAAPALLLETYPDEIYPVDNCAVVASIGLHDRAARADHAALLARWKAHLRSTLVDRRSGLLYQSVDARGASAEWPRASGTAFGLYFISFWDAPLARELFDAVRRECAQAPLGFGAVKEYPRWVRAEGRAGERHGDIDSGPVIFGYGMSPTGFSIAGCRMFGDRALFRRLFASAWLCGAPVERDGRFRYVTGGPLGNAILFAMLTAPPGGVAAAEVKP